jgi:Concanavalin A-like lectin/glucanases superfamily
LKQIINQYQPVNFLSNDQQGVNKKVRVFLGVTVALLAMLVSSCDDTYVPPSVTTGLGKSISSAIDLLLVSPEGSAAGLNAHGSQTTFKSAITIAQTILVTPNVTQDIVDKANADLIAAAAVFKAQKVQGVDIANLAGQWTFDEITDDGNGSQVKDYSGNGRHGTVKTGHVFWGRGTPTLGTDRYGVWGKCLHFNSGANVEVPYNADFNKPLLSISLWIRSDVNDPIVGNQYAVSLNRFNCYGLIFDQNAAPVLMTNPTGVAGAAVYDNSATVVTQNLWKHIVVTFGNGHTMFYVNGTLIKDIVRAGAVVQSPSINLTFGQDVPTDKASVDPSSPFSVYNNGGYWIGYMDEIRIYKSVLTADQVTAIYNIEKP